jgi:hypothetical protein
MRIEYSCAKWSASALSVAKDFRIVIATTSVYLLQLQYILNPIVHPRNHKQDHWASLKRRENASNLTSILLRLQYPL